MKAHVLLIFILIVLVSFFNFLFLNSFKNRKNTFWNSYDAVFYENLSKKDEAKIYSVLEENDFSPISLEDQSYYFNNYYDTELLSYSKLKNRFFEDDKRYDDYMRRSQKFFYSKDKKYKIIYINKVKNINEYFAIVNILKSYPLKVYIYMDYNLDSFLIKFIFISFALALSLFLRRVSSFLFFIVFLPFVFFVNSYAIIIPLLSFYYLICIYSNDIINYQKIPSYDRFLFLVVSFSILFFCLLLSTIFNNNFPVLFSFLLLLASCVLVIYFCKIFGSRNILLENSFLTLPIYILFCGILFFYFLNSSSNLSSVLNFPAPDSFNKSEKISLESLSKLDGENKELLDLSDYVIHRAFQDSYLFDRNYFLPKSGEEVFVYEYSYKGTNLSKKKKVFFVFNNLYLNSIFSDVKKKSFVNVLLKQGLSRVSYKAFVSNKYKGGIYINYIAFFVTILSFFIFFIRAKNKENS